MKPVSGLMSGFWQDVRFGIRQFRRTPGFAVFTVLVLARGIGVVTAMFTIQLWSSGEAVPFGADQQLFDVMEPSAKGHDDYAASYAEIRQWQDASSRSPQASFHASTSKHRITAKSGHRA